MSSAINTARILHWHPRAGRRARSVFSMCALGESSTSSSSRRGSGPLVVNPLRSRLRWRIAVPSDRGRRPARPPASAHWQDPAQHVLLAEGGEDRQDDRPDNCATDAVGGVGLQPISHFTDDCRHARGERACQFIEIQGQLIRGRGNPRWRISLSVNIGQQRRD